jgi:hypothetical protein
MQTWLGGGSGGGGGKKIKLENINADTTFDIPAGYTLVNCVVRFAPNQDTSLAFPEISMGTNVDADNIVPVQLAGFDDEQDNTIFIDYSAKTLTTVTLKAQTWLGKAVCSFYFTLNKYK